MLFYKVTGKLHEEANEIGDISLLENKRKECILQAADEFAGQAGREQHCFIWDLVGLNVRCGAVSMHKMNAEAFAEMFFEQCGLAVSEIKIMEITMGQWTHMLSVAERNGFVEDTDTVLRQLDLDIPSDRRRSFGYAEMVMSEDDVCDWPNGEELNLLTGDTLIPELDRIRRGSRGRRFGHPVHYMIETERREYAGGVFCALLLELYANNRLEGRRFCSMGFEAHRTIEEKDFDSFYKNCRGGTIRVIWPREEDAEENNYANWSVETVDIICSTVLKYQHEVLTVFDLPRDCEKIKKQLCEKLGTVSFVEIRENLLDCVHACSYLKGLSKSREIEPDEELTTSVQTDRKYLPEELRHMFDEWYNRKLKTVVFPQYREMAECRRQAVEEPAKGHAYDELQEMVGLDSAKKVIRKALNYYKLQRIYRDKGLNQDRPAMHMVFTGNPGTAKTTAARLFARIMKENGLLSIGHLVEVGRGSLVGKYVGWTAKTVQQKFKEALGGVLFIDEAYSLVDDRGGSYGDEAINTIVQEMENHREELVVIFSGYPGPMEQFLNRNPGLRSRIAFHVPFDDYGTEELCDIAKLIGKSKGIRFTERALERLAGVFDAAREQPDFGNGRYVRNIIEMSRMNQADRILAMDPDEVTGSILAVIEEEDIEVPVMKKLEKRVIGFAL